MVMPWTNQTFSLGHSSDRKRSDKAAPSSVTAQEQDSIDAELPSLITGVCLHAQSSDHPNSSCFLAWLSRECSQYPPQESLLLSTPYGKVISKNKQTKRQPRKRKRRKNHFGACTIHQVLDPEVSYLNPHNTPEKSRGLILIFVVIEKVIEKKKRKKEKVIEDFPQPSVQPNACLCPLQDTRQEIRIALEAEVIL